MQIETKIELSKSKSHASIFKDFNKLTSNICLSSHFPPFINIQTGDLCTNVMTSYRPVFPLKVLILVSFQDKTTQGREGKKWRRKVFRLVSQDRVSVTPPNLILFMVFSQTLETFGTFDFHNIFFSFCASFNTWVRTFCQLIFICLWGGAYFLPPTFL